jgi:hypothetical protein
LSCPNCKGTENLTAQYEARYPLQHIDGSQYRHGPGEEELLLVECGDCGESFTDETLSIYPSAWRLRGKRIFISHPFASDPQANRRSVSEILSRLHKQYPEVTFVSPLHLFSYMESETPQQRKEVMAMCYDLIDLCDEVWSFGESEGCQLEQEYAHVAGKKYVKCYNNTD